MGWLQPSTIITAQRIPEGGFTAPEVGFLLRLRFEFIPGLCYHISGLGIMVSIRRGRKTIVLLVYGFITIIASVIILNKYVVPGRILFILATLALITHAVLQLRLHQKMGPGPVTQE